MAGSTVLMVDDSPSDLQGSPGSYSTSLSLKETTSKVETRRSRSILGSAARSRL